MWTLSLFEGGARPSFTLLLAAPTAAARAQTCPLVLPRALGMPRWLIICINLTGSRDAQIFDETLFFLGVSVRLFPDEILVRISGVGEELCLPPCAVASSSLSRARAEETEGKEEFCLFPPGCPNCDVDLPSPLALLELQPHTQAVVLSAQTTGAETSQPPQLHKPILCNKCLPSHTIKRIISVSLGNAEME